jgi:hypothetical protein
LGGETERRYTMLLGREKSELICLFANTTKAAMMAWRKTGRAIAGDNDQHVLLYVLNPIPAW